MSEAGRTAEVTYRRAEEADLPRLFEVFRAALNAYLVPAGQPGIPEGDDQSPAYRHYLRHDGERFWVAEAVVEELTDGGGGSLGVTRPSDRRLGERAAEGRLVVPQQPLRAAGGAGPRRRRPAVRAGDDGRAAGSGARHRHRLAAAHLQHPVRAPRPAAARGARRDRRGAAAGSAAAAARQPRGGAAHHRVDPGTARDRRGGERRRPERRPRVLPHRQRPARLAPAARRPAGGLRDAAQGRLGRSGSLRARARHRTPSRPTPSRDSRRSAPPRSAPASPAAAPGRSAPCGRPASSSRPPRACSSPRARSAGSTAIWPPATACSERRSRRRAAPARRASVIRFVDCGATSGGT